VSKNHWIRLAVMMMIALTYVKNGNAYAWTAEMVQSKHKNFVNVAINAFDRATLTFFAIILIFGQRWWVVVGLSYFAAGVISLLVICCMVPESPMWLLMNGHNAEAIEILNQIAARNGSENRIEENVEFAEM